MAIDVTCPSCRGNFKAPDGSSGKPARCPTCGGAITIPFVASPAIENVSHADEGVEGENAPSTGAGPGVAAPAAILTTKDRKACPKCGEFIQRSAVKCRFCGEVLDRTMARVLGAAGNARDPAWRRVRAGLTLIYYSLVGAVLVALLMAMATVVSSAMSEPRAAGAGQSPGLATLLGIGVLLLFAAGFCVFVAQALCATVPRASGAREFVIGTVCCIIVNVLCSIAGRVTEEPLIGGAGRLIGLAGTVLFLLFIRQSATYLGDSLLARSATRFIVFSVVVFGGAYAMILAAAEVQAIAAVGILGLIVLVMGLIAFVWYMRLITSLRAAIDRRSIY